MHAKTKYIILYSLHITLSLLMICIFCGVMICDLLLTITFNVSLVINIVPSFALTIISSIRFGFDFIGMFKKVKYSNYVDMQFLMLLIYLIMYFVIIIANIFIMSNKKLVLICGLNILIFSLIIPVEYILFPVLLIARREICKTIHVYEPVTVIDDVKDESCCICLNKLSENVIKLKCNHYFHNNCISDWFGVNMSCPICRENYQEN